MYIMLYRLLIMFLMSLGISSASKAMIDSYSFEEGSPMRSIFPPISAYDFRTQVVEPLDSDERNNIHFLRFGVGVVDEDIPELVDTIQSNFSSIHTLDLSDGNVTVNGMITLIPLLLLDSLTTVYPSPNFVQADIPALTSALSVQGISEFDQRSFIEKIKPKPRPARFYGKRKPEGKNSFLEGAR